MEQYNDAAVKLHVQGKLNSFIDNQQKAGQRFSDQERATAQQVILSVMKDLNTPSNGTVLNTLRTNHLNNPESPLAKRINELSQTDNVGDLALYTSLQAALVSAVGQNPQTQSQQPQIVPDNTTESAGDATTTTTPQNANTGTTPATQITQQPPVQPTTKQNNTDATVE